MPNPTDHEIQDCLKHSDLTGPQRACVFNAIALVRSQTAMVLDRVVVDTSTETTSTIYSFDVLNSDINGHVLRLELAGEYLNNSGANRDSDVEILLGSSLVVTISVTFPANASTRVWSLVVEFTSRSTTDQKVTGALWFSDAATFTSPSASLSYMILGNGASDTSNTNSATGISIIWSHSAASGPTLYSVVKAGALTRL